MYVLQLTTSFLWEPVGRVHKYKGYSVPVTLPRLDMCKIAAFLSIANVLAENISFADIER